MKSKLDLTSYIIRFTISYAGLLIGFLAITMALDVDAPTSIAALIGAIFYVSGKFVQDHKRVPNKSEFFHLSWASLGSSILVSFVLVIIYLRMFGASQLIQAFSQMNMGIFAAIFIVILGLHFVLIWFFYWWCTKFQFKALQKKEAAKVK